MPPATSPFAEPVRVQESLDVALRFEPPIDQRVMCFPGSTGCAIIVGLLAVPIPDLHPYSSRPSTSANATMTAATTPAIADKRVVARRPTFRRLAVPVLEADEMRDFLLVAVVHDLHALDLSYLSAQCSSPFLS